MGRAPKNNTSLRRIMTAKGLTCQKLADMTDIPKTTIENVAVGLQKFSPDRFVVVCRALDCVESDLADVKGNRPKNATSLRRIMTAKGLTAEKLGQMTGIPKNTIAAAAYGGQKFSPERFADVCRVLGCTESDLADVKGGRRGHKPKPEHPWAVAKSATAAAEKPKPGNNPIEDSEKLWLYVHQLQRRVAQLEDQVKAAGL